jgi:hypothetical protein
MFTDRQFISARRIFDALGSNGIESREQRAAAVFAFAHCMIVEHGMQPDDFSGLARLAAEAIPAAAANLESRDGG